MFGSYIPRALTFNKKGNTLVSAKHVVSSFVVGSVIKSATSSFAQVWLAIVCPPASATTCVAFVNVSAASSALSGGVTGFWRLDKSKVGRSVAPGCHTYFSFGLTGHSREIAI